MKKGYIKLYRQIQDSTLYKQKRRFSRNEAWIDLLLSANHKESEILVGARKIKVKKGEVFTSQYGLAKKWNWAIGSVSNFLKLLEKECQITYLTESKFTRVFLVKWAFFQGSEEKVERKMKGKNEIELKNLKARNNTLSHITKGEKENESQEVENKLKANPSKVETYKNVYNKKKKEIGNKYVSLISSFKEQVKEIKGYTPEINYSASVSRIKQLIDRKAEPMSEDDILELFKLYLKGEKSKNGLTINGALSSHSINCWKQAKNKSKELYAD